VVYVTDDPRQSAIEAELVRRLRERVGKMRIETVRVSSVPRGANGKFRAVVSRIRTPQVAVTEN
jgi:hypothetical protein